MTRPDPASPAAPDWPPALALLGAGGHAQVALRLIDACLESWRERRGGARFSRLLVTGASQGFLDEARAVLAAHLAPDAEVASVADDAALRAATADAPRVFLVNGVGRRPQRRPEAGPQAWSGGEAAFLDAYEAAPDWFLCPALVHPSAIALDRLTPQGEGWRAAAGPGLVAAGAQIHAGCVIGARARIGRFAIVNTRASLDHDCEIGARAFVGPGAVLCGGVVVEPGAFVGAGAVVLPSVRIGAGAVAPAGATIRRDVPAGRIASG